jgi:hypothetical protein
MRVVTEETPTAPSGVRSARPGRGAQLLATLAIVLAGTCGALIGYAFTDLQCEGDCTVANGVSGLVGGVLGAGGTAVVVVLALRAMGEWQTIRDRDDP